MQGKLLFLGRKQKTSTYAPYFCNYALLLARHICFALWKQGTHTHWINIIIPLETNTSLLMFLPRPVKSETLLAACPIRNLSSHANLSANQAFAGKTKSMTFQSEVRSIMSWRTLEKKRSWCHIQLDSCGRKSWQLSVGRSLGSQRDLVSPGFIGLRCLIAELPQSCTYCCYLLQLQTSSNQIFQLISLKPSVSRRDGLRVFVNAPCVAVLKHRHHSDHLARSPANVLGGWGVGRSAKSWVYQICWDLECNFRTV